MRTNKMIGLLIVAGAGFWLFTSYQNKLKREQELLLLQKKYSNSGPPSQTPDWYQWISLIISLYGTAASLWQPGGPFYKTSVPNPATDPAGWAKVFTQTRF